MDFIGLSVDETMADSGSNTSTSSEWSSSDSEATVTRSNVHREQGIDKIYKQSGSTALEDERTSSITATGDEGKKTNNEEELIVEGNSDDFFEREWHAHPWSISTAASSNFDVPLNNPCAEDFRLLESDEELLTDGSDSDDDAEDLSYEAWRQRTHYSSDVHNLTMEHLQILMDLDKDHLNGTAAPWPLRSIVQKKGIGDRVERRRRLEWAEEMGRRYPGRYVPYPGRPVRLPPSQIAAQRVRWLERTS